MKKGVRKEIYNEFVLLFDAECLIIPSMDYCDILSHILISWKLLLVIQVLILILELQTLCKALNWELIEIMCQVVYS